MFVPFIYWARPDWMALSCGASPASYIAVSPLHLSATRKGVEIASGPSCLGGPRQTMTHIEVVVRAGADPIEDGATAREKRRGDSDVAEVLTHRLKGRESVMIRQTCKHR